MYASEVARLPVLRLDQPLKSPDQFKKIIVKDRGYAHAIITRRLLDDDRGPIVLARLHGQSRGMDSLYASLTDALGKPLWMREGYEFQCSSLDVGYGNVQDHQTDEDREIKIARLIRVLGQFYELSAEEVKVLKILGGKKFREKDLEIQRLTLLETSFAKQNANAAKRAIQLLTDFRFWQMVDCLPNGSYIN